MSTKKHIFSFLISFSVFCIGALVLLSFFISSKKDGKLLETIFRKEPPYVIYVHGWAPDPSITQVKEVEILKSELEASKKKIEQLRNLVNYFKTSPPSAIRIQRSLSKMSEKEFQETYKVFLQEIERRNVCEPQD